jgi:putative hydrolase of the HAD superfamily
MITTVLFDAGNTLVELDFEVVAGVFAREGVETAPDTIREAAGRTRPALDRFIRELRSSTESTDARVFYMSLVFDLLGVPEDGTRERIAARLAPVFPQLWGSMMPGLEETLRALRDGGYRLGVVSNSDGSVARGFEESGLAAWFDAVVDSGVEGVEKPDPEIFRIALERVGAGPEEAVHVGDMPSVDVAGALAAGVTPILIDPFDAFPETDVLRIRSLPELPGMLESIL